MAKETIAGGFGGHLVFDSRSGRALCADSEEKQEPASDIDTTVVDSLKVLAPTGQLERRTFPFSAPNALRNGAQSCPMEQIATSYRIHAYLRNGN